jgi:hypothetical protein
MKPMNPETTAAERGAGADERAGELTAYYADVAVRQRIVEFLGGDSPATATCHYVTGDDRESAVRRPRRNVELPACLDEGLDLGRALWDREALIAHLDVEYVNFDHPLTAYEDAPRTFDLQKPVAGVIKTLLGKCGIHPLEVLSGRGYHFVWRIDRRSEVFRDLAAMGRTTPSLRQLNARAHPPEGESVTPEMGAAFAGLGLLMEYLAHQVKELAAPGCSLPVELTAVEAGPRFRDREIISVDISGYGDPLHTRTLRVPFSVYLKPAQQHWQSGGGVRRELPLILFLPLQGIGPREALAMRGDPVAVAKLAAAVSTKIPDQADGTRQLLSEYHRSSLAEFHRSFYSEEPQPPEKWAETYDLTRTDVLPGCARMVLESPNDWLLRPAGVRLVTRVLVSLGWHPRHIAGLIWSKFARDFGWGGQWAEDDAATRADFYTRIFAGLFATGRDDLLDFNCQSAREEGTCTFADCHQNLEMYRHSALRRRTYDHLANRPFHRLFSPREYP